ncbi:MAG: CBS domain-containing protein, partial [bacterium]|nr:CBS domain-containing protein [bacterium]
MKNINLAAICLKKSDTIRDAMRRMAQNKPQRTHIPAGIVLVTDAAGKLMGIATDGDIRRALSRGAGLDSLISRVMNTNPFLIVGQHSGEEILALVADKIRRESWHKDRLDKIVVVDKNKKVLNLVSFYDLWHQSDIRFKHMGIVGLGYVGLTLGLTLADLGFRVKGMDTDSKVRRAVSGGKPH